LGEDISRLDGIYGFQNSQFGTVKYKLSRNKRNQKNALYKLRLSTKHPVSILIQNLCPDCTNFHKHYTSFVNCKHKHLTSTVQHGTIKLCRGATPNIVKKMKRPEPYQINKNTIKTGKFPKLAFSQSLKNN